MRQLLSEKCIRHTLRRCFEDCDLVSSSEWGMMDCCDMWGPQDPHSSSQVASYSEIVCVPLFCTQPIVPHGCYLTWMCVRVCVRAFLYERLACRGGWSDPWEYPLWQHITTSLSLFWHPPLITALQLFDCSFIVFCPSPCLEGDDVTTHELCKFGGLPKGETEKFSVLLYGQKEWKTTRVKGSYEFVFHSFMTPVGDHFHHMMKSLPKGCNDFQVANFPRSTGWVVSDNWAAVYYKFITPKCMKCSFDVFCATV